MFRRKLAQAIVKARYILTVCILAAAVICCVTISKTRINYDMNRYLSDDTMTKRALVVMEQEFGSAEQLRIMFTDRTEQQLEEYVAALNTAPEVMLAAHDPESGVILAEAAFMPGDADSRECMDGVLAACREVYGENFYVAGVHMSAYDISGAFHGDLLKVNLITLLAILLIVTVSFRSFRIPLLLVFVIEGAIWITMGASMLFGEEIFFVSYLICLSIQMGATIDYGILLSDQYRALRLEGNEPREAMAEAMKKALPTVLTSGIILTVAGFIIGVYCSIYYISSIGLLVSRGALVSVLLVLSLLPALLLITEKFQRLRPELKQASHRR